MHNATMRRVQGDKVRMVQRIWKHPEAGYEAGMGPVSPQILHIMTLSRFSLSREQISIRVSDTPPESLHRP
jgi:hypothetical protein